MPRKQHSYHYIYKTICAVTGKFYVGMHSTSNLEDNYIGSGKRLWYSIRKHGRENHTKEILEFFQTREELRIREKEIVNERFIADPMCMNLKEGGDGGWSKETQSKAGKISKNWQKNLRTPSKEERIRNSKRICEILLLRTGSKNGWKGRKHSAASKLKISAALKIANLGEKKFSIRNLLDF